MSNGYGSHSRLPAIFCALLVAPTSGRAQFYPHIGCVMYSVIDPSIGSRCIVYGELARCVQASEKPCMGKFGAEIELSRVIVPHAQAVLESVID